LLTYATHPIQMASVVMASELDSSPPEQERPSYIKLAMRNMVRKGGKSLTHFGLTIVALLGLLIGLAYLTR